MANGSGLFKPSTSTSGLGKKKQEDGQFINPPAYPETSGFSSAGKIKKGQVGQSMQKAPTAKSGKV